MFAVTGQVRQCGNIMAGPDWVNMSLKQPNNRPGHAGRGSAENVRRPGPGSVMRENVRQVPGEHTLQNQQNAGPGAAVQKMFAEPVWARQCGKIFAGAIWVRQELLRAGTG